MCPLAKVEHLLEEAAEIVTQIRSLLPEDEHAPLEGSSREYLLSLESLPSEEEFVLGLVHATFQAGDKSYTNGLNASKLDDYISEVLSFNASHQTTDFDGPLASLFREGQALQASLLKKWEETNELIKTLSSNDHILWSTSTIENLRAIENSIDIVRHQLGRVRDRRDFKRTRSLNRLLSSRRLEKKSEAGSNEPATAQAEPDVPKTESPAPTASTASESTTAPQPAPESPEEKKRREELEKGLLVVEMVHKKAEAVDQDLKEIVASVQNVQNLADHPKEAMTEIAGIKKKAAKFLHDLMEDMLKLDSLSVEGIRPARKKEITNIQHIIDSIEKLQADIHKLEVQFQPAVEQLQKQEEAAEREAREAREKAEREAREKAEREARERAEKAEEERRIKEAKAAKERAERLALEKEKARENNQLQLREDALRARQRDLQSSVEQARTRELARRDEDEDDESEALQETEESPWRRLKLDVNLNVTEKPNAFYITGNIPGLLLKDIHVKVEDNKLIITGFREPSEVELQQMQRAMLARGYRPRTQKEALVAYLKMGVGRFGTFQQTFQLPRDGSVDTAKIEASYQHGLLRVTVPKVIAVPQARPVPQQDPFGRFGRGYPQQRPLGNRGFFQDPSVWW